MSKLTINRTLNGSSAIAIRGLNLFNSTKNVFLDKVNATVQSVCVKDADSSFESISSKCDGSNETLVACNNQSTGQYACFDTGVRYMVTGLNHSAIKEECIDNDGDGYGVGCSAGTDCDDNDRSKTTSCSSGSNNNGGGGSGGGGGGGGGGGAGGFVCNHEWQCSDWNICANVFQTRECNFAKVPQHVQDAECQDENKIPATTKTCEIKKEIIAVNESKLISEQIQQTNLSGAAIKSDSISVSGEKLEKNSGFSAITGRFTKLAQTLNIWVFASVFAAIALSIVFILRHNKNKIKIKK